MTSKAVFGHILSPSPPSAVWGSPASRSAIGVVAKLTDRRDLAVAFDERKG